MGQDHSTPGAGCRTPDLLFRLDSFLKFPQSSSGIEVCLREIAPFQASATIYGFIGIANVYGFVIAKDGHEKCQKRSASSHHVFLLLCSFLCGVSLGKALLELVIGGWWLVVGG